MATNGPHKQVSLSLSVCACVVVVCGGARARVCRPSPLALISSQHTMFTRPQVDIEVRLLTLEQTTPADWTAAVGRLQPAGVDASGSSVSLSLGLSVSLCLSVSVSLSLSLTHSCSAACGLRKSRFRCVWWSRGVQHDLGRAHREELHSGCFSVPYACIAPSYHSVLTIQ